MCKGVQQTEVPEHGVITFLLNVGAYIQKYKLNYK
jgi:hypothetical protein